jgi:hypothetical protein
MQCFQEYFSSVIVLHTFKAFLWAEDVCGVFLSFSRQSDEILQKPI